MLIYIIGFMGAGKTTFGKKGARQLGYDFIDLDDLIERQAEKTIATIFKEGGEDLFRQLEKEALESTITMQHTVIATGGGTPCFYNNMKLMLKYGKVVYLEVDSPILLNRLQNQQSKRPLIAMLNRADLEQFVVQKLKEREPYYTQSHITLTTSEVENVDLSTLF